MDACNSILLYGHGGSQNRGCEAIVRSTSRILKDALGPRTFIRVSSRTRLYDTEAGISSVDAFMDSGSTWPPGSFMQRAYATVSWRIKNPARRVMLDNLQTIGWAPRSDVCLAVGGDNYCYDTAFWWYPLQRLLRKLCSRMVLWGCSIERDRMDAAMIADLKAFDLIVARESLTFEALHEHGFTKVRRYPDPAFTLPVELLPLPEGWREGQMVGLNLSPLIESFEQQRGTALEACLELVRHILQNSSLGVVLVPHVTWPTSDDRRPLAQIQSRFAGNPRVLMLPGNLNAPQLKGYISRCRLFIGARTHATIAAYSTGVPTLVLGYSVKARGIARDLFGDEKGLVLPVQELSEPRPLLNAFGELAERERDLRVQLAAVLPDHIRSARDAGWEIRALLD